MSLRASAPYQVAEALLGVSERPPAKREQSHPSFFFVPDTDTSATHSYLCVFIASHTRTARTRSSLISLISLCLLTTHLYDQHDDIPPRRVIFHILLFFLFFGMGFCLFLPRIYPLYAAITLTLPYPLRNPPLCDPLNTYIILGNGDSLMMSDDSLITT